MTMTVRTSLPALNTCRVVDREEIDNADWFRKYVDLVAVGRRCGETVDFRDWRVGRKL